MAKDSTDNSFESDVLTNSKAVLVDFWAPWCGPCKQLGPIIDQIAEEMSSQIDVFKINIDDNPEIPSKYMVRGIPTMIIFKDGKVVDTKVGSLPKSSLKEWVESNI
jgi:thioredoxin 1|tara:strand:- start:1138 stop:1455 length:318 start_codon:yes stop_codon:yes gene_type:complete